MKKITLVSSIAIIALASCSKSNDAPSNNNTNGATTKDQIVGTWEESPIIEKYDYYSASNQIVFSTTDTDGFSNKLIFSANGTLAGMTKDNASEPYDTTSGSYTIGSDTTLFNAIAATKMSMGTDMAWVKIQGQKLYLYTVDAGTYNGAPVSLLTTSIFDKQ
jgi:hypothetical protein